MMFGYAFETSNNQRVLKVWFNSELYTCTPQQLAGAYLGEAQGLLIANIKFIPGGTFYEEEPCDDGWPKPEPTGPWPYFEIRFAAPIAYDDNGQSREAILLRSVLEIYEVKPPIRQRWDIPSDTDSDVGNPAVAHVLRSARAEDGQFLALSQTDGGQVPLASDPAAATEVIRDVIQRLGRLL